MGSFNVIATRPAYRYSHPLTDPSTGKQKLVSHNLMVLHTCQSTGIKDKHIKSSRKKYEFTHPSGEKSSVEFHLDLTRQESSSSGLGLRIIGWHIDTFFGRNIPTPISVIFCSSIGSVDSSGNMICDSGDIRFGINDTEVVPEFKRYGIGRAMVDFALEWMKAEGVHDVYGEASGRVFEDGRNKAVVFWKSIGFSVDTSRGYWELPWIKKIL